MNRFGRIFHRTLATLALAGLFAAPASANQGTFDATGYRCLDYINGQGAQSAEKGKADLAAFWVQGFLAGYGFKNDTLEFDEEAGREAALNADLKAACEKYPEAGLISVSVEVLTKDKSVSLPLVAGNGFDATTYTCEAFANADSGSAADALKADLADFYAFAFVQGYVSGTDAELVLPIESKAPVSGALKKYCTQNPEYLFLDLTKAVAPMIKAQ